MSIGLSHGGTTIYSSPTLSKEVLVGTREGVLTIARDAGAKWQVTQRAITDKHISAILKEPESGTTFAGAFHGGVHVSSDGGKSWQERGNGMTQNNVYSLAAHRFTALPPAARPEQRMQSKSCAPKSTAYWRCSVARPLPSSIPITC